MAPSDPAPVVGGIAFALCPLLCIGLPVLASAGIGSGLALAIGGAVIGGLALVVLAVGALVVLRRRRNASCCEPAATERELPGSSRSALPSAPSSSVRP
jgi:hypothetical protein